MASTLWSKPPGRSGTSPRWRTPRTTTVYFDPNLNYNGPLVAAPILEPIQPARPKFVPKPFVPRERKQVKKLQPAGPVLYTAPEASYGSEARYGGAPVQDLSKIPGQPGQDYPLYDAVPETGFTCDQVPYRPGLYADAETGCQAYHICGEDNRHGYAGASFLCTNGTLFNQYELTCDWWYNVDCGAAVKQYDVNLDPYKNPYLPTPEEEAKRSSQQYAPEPQYSYGPGFAPEPYNK
ncbi:uncharacterized protein LOC119100354 [Pollicipes pollicipes]|uniref:uncharacterized protein LOC119100354 n=1 Tax=Pollicipes pollicipes TaxID=41117 RepID=UPI0018852061|nr:uncharacterized protein LOC119100354 [Pollicipes pollicipes]